MPIEQKNLEDHLHAVVGPRFAGDDRAEQHLQKVSEYIHTTLEQYGWDCNLQEFAFDQLKTAWGRTVKNRYGTNIIAEKPGQTDEVLIIATHHDSVPASPGADDNGTGIAALLEIARILVGHQSRYTLRLISFDHEETGLLGSEWYVQHLPQEEQQRIRGMIMLEMLGYFTTEEQQLPTGFDKLYWREIRRIKTKNGLHGNFLACVYRASAKFIANAFKKTRDADNMEVALIRDAVDLPIIGSILNNRIPSLQNLLRSDHTPFWFRDIPAVMITDTANFRNPHYHQPSDTLDTLNYPEFTRATKRVLDMIQLLITVKD